MPTLLTTCPLSGLTYTITDDYSVIGFDHSVHRNYHKLPDIIKKERWKAPASYLAAGILYQLQESGLIEYQNQESSIVRPTINNTLQTLHPARLYALYVKCRDTKASLAISPIKVNLTTIHTRSASEIYAKLEIVALQSLSLADKAEVSRLSVSRHSTRKIGALTLSKEHILKASPAHRTARLVSETPKLYDLLSSQEEITLPYTAKQVRKVCRAIPRYSDLPNLHQRQLLKVLASIFEAAYHHSFVTHDDDLGKAYDWFKDTQSTLAASDDLDFL